MSVAPPRPRLRLRLDQLEDRAVPAVVQLGAADYDTGDAVAADAAGNIYVGGTFRGTVDFDRGPGTVTLTSTGTPDAYLAKYSAAGSLVWVESHSAGPRPAGGRSR
jgi:hypothetical protein